MDYFKLPLKGKNPKVVTYDEIYDTIPDDIKGKISLYNYHAMLDSLGEGHNMMRRTKISGTNGKRIVESLVLKGESSFIQDPELFRLQYGTFDITKYPGYDRAVELISSLSKIDVFPKPINLLDNEMIMGALKGTVSFKEMYDKAYEFFSYGNDASHEKKLRYLNMADDLYEMIMNFLPKDVDKSDIQNIRKQIESVVNDMRL